MKKIITVVILLVLALTSTSCFAKEFELGEKIMFHSTNVIYQDDVVTIIDDSQQKVLYRCSTLNQDVMQIDHYGMGYSYEHNTIGEYYTPIEDLKYLGTSTNDDRIYITYRHRNERDILRVETDKEGRVRAITFLDGRL